MDTDPDAEFDIYSFGQYSNKFIIKNKDMKARWRSSMGVVHIGHHNPIDII